MGLDKKEDLCNEKKLGDGFSSGECSYEILDGFRNFWDCEMGNTFESKRDEMNIADLLPKDPFDMEFSATISEWIKELEKDFEFLKSLGFVDTDESSEVKDDDDNYFKLNCEIMSFRYEEYSISSCVIEDIVEDISKSSGEYSGENDEDSPHDALYYVLNYLEVEDLLNVEKVCKDLRNAVRDDPLLWRNYHIGHPLCYKITNEPLLRLTDRANGMLQSLSLDNCLNITHTGLSQVLNPHLTKLSIRGCLRLRIDGVISNLRDFKSKSNPGIKHLRVGGIYGINPENFEELKLLLGVKDPNPNQKPRYYDGGQLYVPVDDELALDIETCPRCQKIKEVYDCPLGPDHGPCKGCIKCIPRCIDCGRCIDSCDYEEMFFLEHICLECQNNMVGPDEEVTIVHHSTGSFSITLLSI